MTSVIDNRPYLMALMAMNIQVIAEFSALAPTPEKARNIMFHFEQKILENLNKLEIGLEPNEGPDDLAAIRQSASQLVQSLLASTKFL
ncbi:hypothetical protein IB024_01335 [Brucella sp. 6810]|uniref:hypothetical protein n=1 Tax=Brucella sp. 6810 TaxID=2769351 RepID=UPI00165AA29E|nr:hypothetical protein [Brucella sp. 6810]QNQ62432.1 hypothetical protein IB024_01335 [Brucella sp. 6810]